MLHGDETQKKPADLGLSLSEQKLHPFLNKLRMGDELELDCSTVTGTKDTLGVIHVDNSYGLTDRLGVTGENFGWQFHHTSRLTPQCNIAYREMSEKYRTHGVKMGEPDNSFAGSCYGLSPL